MASNFIPNYGNESNISTNIQNGNLYVSEDTKRLFFDLNGNRIKISDIVFSDERPLIGISGKLYVIKSDNSLWIFEDAWKQLNSGSSTSVNIDNKTINKNSDDEIQSIGVIDSRSGEPVKYWTGTLVQYNAIENKDDNTIYNITDDIIDVNQSYFIPAGTILTVKTDGSGQFTKLSEAINYLTGKWSNGTVTVQLGEGEFIEENTINIPEFNINTLKIVGQGVDKTSISCSNTTNYNYVMRNTLANIQLENFLLKGNIDYKQRGLYAGLNGVYTLNNLNLIDFERGSMFIDSTRVYLKGIFDIGSSSSNKVVDTGMQSVNGGLISIQSGASITFNKCAGAFYCNGAIISSYPNTKITYNNVTNNKISVKGGLYLGGLSG